MKGFLKFIGVVEIVAYFVGIIAFPIAIAMSDPATKGVSIVYFILYIIFAPTIGILCLCVSSLLESREIDEEIINRLTSELNKSTAKVEGLVEINKVEKPKQPVEKKVEKPKSKASFGKLLSVGSKVCFEQNVSVSMKDRRVISKGTIGVIRSVENDKITVSCDLNGEEVYTTHDVSVFSLRG